MSKINLLSSKIYNRIAAGEVVERPFSVVKELVENSIDAGAKNITIEIEKGGMSVVRISDDGSGIEKSELKKALLPHATSKISNLSDLENICSLGFRGEALSSIASVSKIRIISKPKEQDIGAQIYAEGGEVESIEECASTNGTEITVSSLFYNTPAREKFLRSERSEENDISIMVARFVLGNPEIAFRYLSNGKLVFQSFGDGFESAVAQIYGLETIKSCYYIETQKNGLQIKGYLGKPNFYKGNRSYQTVFLNGRFIINQTISSAISNAYSAYLMTRQYPFYVLSLNVPTEIVDVNVHPNKLDVRFSNNQIIYGSIYSVISKVLDGSTEALSIISNSTTPIVDNSKIINNDNKDDYVKNNPIEQATLSGETFKFDVLTFHDIANEDSNKETHDSQDVFAENKRFLENLDKKNKSTVDTINKNETDTVAEAEVIRIDVKRSLSFVGQALNTYLIFDDGLDMYLVDQHAAHERILYDKIIEDFNKKTIDTQPILIPYTLNVNSAEFNFLLDNLAIINNMGIEIVEFGRNSFKVSAIPVYLAEMSLQKFFNEILSDINSFKQLTASALLADKFAQKACKAAIKSGDKLSVAAVETIKKAVENNLGLKCPHGRPVVIKITRTEIDKWFKRIL